MAWKCAAPATFVHRNKSSWELDAYRCLLWSWAQVKNTVSTTTLECLLSFCAGAKHIYTTYVHSIFLYIDIFKSLNEKLELTFRSTKSGKLLLKPCCWNVSTYISRYSQTSCNSMCLQLLCLQNCFYNYFYFLLYGFKLV